MTRRQSSLGRSYDSLRGDRAFDLINEHYGEGIDIYSLWAEIPDALKAWRHGLENVASHPAQLHYAWLNNDDGSSNGLALNDGIRLATSSAIEQLGLDYSRPVALLDVGCGVGGSALQADLFLQQQEVMEYEVHGISIVADQIRLASLRCRRLGAAHIEFLIGNSLHLPYKSSFFDGILAIETFCHIPPQDKSRLLKGCIRVLAPGGRLVVLDGYVAREERTAEEEYWLTDLRDGLTLPELITAGQMSNLAIESGLELENTFEASSQVRPSVKLIYIRGKYILMPLLRIYRLLKRLGHDSRLLRRTGAHTPNAAAAIQAGLAQKELVKRDVVTYHVHVLRRPIYAI
ncbi:MAG: class I SAM-dependent methyltransferase [Anaerolineales bacterium]